jgi:L-ascorbate metabolism protein UlaG (beta-lactamase superfamily)
VKTTIIIAMLILICGSGSAQNQGLTIEEIMTNLWYHPPNIGDPALREQTILELDGMLNAFPVNTASDVKKFYKFMMLKANSEFKQTIAGESIQMMYNHGFIVKTAQVNFAFDLVTYLESLPLLDELFREIDVLFVSHEHGDHYSQQIKNIVLANGGYVIVPSEFTNIVGNMIGMAPGDSLNLMGLTIKAYFGLHNAPVRMYEVTTPGGLKMLHTGDNQTTATLPAIDSLDVLLLNAWLGVFEMRHALNILSPEIMIPGHIQELGHPTRVPYQWAYEVDDVPVPSEVKVMTWGERFIFSDQYNELFVYGGHISDAFLSINMDPLTIQTEIYNPENRNLEVEAIIASTDSTVEDSIFLYDDGNHMDSLANDGIWGNQFMPVSTENDFKATVSVVDLDSGVYCILNDMARFTSIGPLLFEEYTITSSDTIPNPGDRLKFKFTLRNSGLTGTANNITARLASLDTFATPIGSIIMNFGDIPAGEILSGDRIQYILFSPNCPDSIYAKFRLDISSNHYLLLFK